MLLTNTITEAEEYADRFVLSFAEPVVDDVSETVREFFRVEGRALGPYHMGADSHTVIAYIDDTAEVLAILRDAKAVVAHDGAVFARELDDAWKDREGNTLTADKVAQYLLDKDFDWMM